ncbi:MAG: PAS domain-containing protein [Deltaproteobacteria bacterium]|nr:PAS domain-containing protein [Deltaproteobacteria bacterium]
MPKKRRESHLMSPARILIVEDEGIEALDLQQRLNSLGYSAPDIASTGEEAVKMAEAGSPDLVLMDIMLSGEIDGVTAAGQIQARFDIPIIYLTAYADEDTLQRAKITEPYAYIVKPFRERDLHITIDVALYKHTLERKLKESEKWLATTLRSIGDAVIATDKNGLITFMNPVAEGLTGWQLKEVLNKKLTEVFNIINRDSRRPVENPVARVILEGHIVGLANHTRLIARNGTEIPIDDSAAPIKDDRGNLIGLVLVFRDITEREKAEDALSQAKEEWEQTFHTVPDLLAILDHQHRIVRVNRSMADRLGVTPEQCIGLRCYEAVHGMPEKPGFCPHALTCQDGRQHIAEVHEPRLGGDFLVSTTPMCDSRGKVIGAVHVARDITERKAAERKLQQHALELWKLTEDLEQRVKERTEELAGANALLERDIAERRRAEEQLKESEKKLRHLSAELMTAQEKERKRIAGELHDSIAASLSAIKFSIEKILDQKEQDEEIQGGLRDLVSKVQQIIEETRRIMSDLRPSLLDDLGIVPAINWFCREFQKTYSSLSIERLIGIEETRIPDSLRTPIFRICQEALNNIAKHGKSTMVNLCLREVDGGIELTIKDNGRGFDLGTVRRGLGLSTMRERTELSGGVFNIESAAGKGTVIRVSWPVT